MGVKHEDSISAYAEFILGLSSSHGPTTFIAVQRKQAYKYRLNVRTQEARTCLSRTVGCCRFVWNRAVSLSTRQDEWLGIDVGISQYATLSDGTHYRGVDALKRNQRKLARLQRRLKKRKKGSRRYKKAALRVARMHHHIACLRANRAHQVSSELVKNHGRIRMEDLRLVNMMKSAKGTQENPGRNVAAKSGLKRRLADQGLRTLRSFIEYKLAWSGGLFEPVDPRHTSQKCHSCKHITKVNRPTQATFLCVACGHADHADVNAAKNIRDIETAAGAGRSERTRRRRRRPAGAAYTPTAA